MTIGLIEGLIILALIVVVVGLAFRTGYTRGRRSEARPDSERPNSDRQG
jgi:hypothetical protein